VKVGKKVFAFLGAPGRGFHLSVKLARSAPLALGLPFASPTGYGLGRSGWVTARFGPGGRPPVPLLKRWIDESYRAVAPRRMVERIGSADERPGPRKRSVRQRAPGPGSFGNR
jgi:hypothetical protein